jgi:DNA-binding protein H-NS
VVDINYNELTLEQLKEINRKSAAAIAAFESRRKKEAVAKATEIAKAAGFSSLKDMLSAEPAKSRETEPKYRHPENPELTWSGRGRKPNWIADAVEAGKSLEDFKIQDADHQTEAEREVAVEEDTLSSDQVDTATGRRGRKPAKVAEQAATNAPVVKPDEASEAAPKVSADAPKVTKSRKPKANQQTE